MLFFIAGFKAGAKDFDTMNAAAGEAIARTAREHKNFIFFFSGKG
jgi:hypothetical protein